MAVYDLGLTTAEFYALTLPQFMALRERWLEAEKRADRRTARIVAHIVNMAGKTVKKTFGEDDFMPGEKSNKAQTPAEMIAILRQFTDFRKAHKVGQVFQERRNGG